MPMKSPNSGVNACLFAVFQGTWAESGQERVRRIAARLEPVAGTLPGLREYLHLLSDYRTAQATGIRSRGEVSRPALDAARQRMSRWIMAIKAHAHCESIRVHIRSIEQDIAAINIARSDLVRRLEEAHSRLQEALRAQGDAGRASVKSLLQGRISDAAARAAQYAARVSQAQAEVKSLEAQREELERNWQRLQDTLDDLRLAFLHCMHERDLLRG
jgi:chromosome segregation ATPase